MSIKPLLVPGVVLGIAIGLAIGVGAYTFVYARGYSYMTDNAEAAFHQLPGLASKVSDRAWIGTVPPRGSGGVNHPDSIQ